MHERSFGLDKIKSEALWIKGSKYGELSSRQAITESSPRLAVTSRQSLHSLHESSILVESSPNVAVMSRQPLPSRQASWLFKELRFSPLSSFRISIITSSTDVQIQWFKMLWKDNSENYNFHERNFPEIKLFGWTKMPLKLQTLHKVVTFGVKWCPS